MNVFDLVARISLNTSEYDSGLDAASSKTSSFGDKLKSGLATAAKVGAAAIGAATTAATAFAASSVKTGMTFDSSMSQVAATMGYSVSELNDKSSEAAQSFTQLRDFAMDMGANTAFSATEAADALNYMALAGYDAETSMNMLPTVLNLAAAGGIDLASASDMVTDAQSALGLTLDETVAMVDQMAKTASKSNTSVAQLGDAILTVGGTASYMADGTNEINAVLGVLADNGIKGSEAGTHLRNMLLSLSSPTKDASALLDSLGIEVFNADGKMRSFSEIFPELNDSMSELTDQQKLDAFSTLFNTRDIAAATALLNTTTERWDELGDAILDSKDAAEEMAAVQLDNLNGDVTLFKSALEGAQIILSDQLTPDLREFVQFGTEAITTLSEAFKEGGLSGAMEALGTILSDGLNMVIEQLPAMIDAGMQLIGALGQGLLENLPAITDAAVEIVLTLADGIIEGLPELATGAVEIISTLASGIGEALPELIPAAVEAVLKFLEGLTNPESIANLMSGAVTLIEGLIEGIVQALPLLIAYAPEIIANLVMGLIAAIPQLLEVGVQLVAGLIEGLIQGILAIPEAIARVVSAIVDGFKALFGIHSPSTVMADMGVNLIEGLLQGISDTWNSILEFFGTAVEGLISFLGEAWESVKSAAATAWEAIQGVFSDAQEGIQSIWEGVVDFFSGIWDGIQGVFSAVADVLGGFFSSAWSAVQGAWNAATEFFGGIADGIHSAFETVTGFLSDAFSSAWDLIQGVWDAAVGFFQGVWDGISGAFSSAAEWFGDLFSRARSAVETAWDSITSFFSDTWESIKNVFSDVWEKFKEIGGNIVNGLKDGILGAWNAFTGWLGDKIGGLVDFAKGILGIHSPSTEFASIGENIVLGLQSGVDGEGSAIDSSMENIVATMKGAFSNIADIMSDIGKNAMQALTSSFAPAIAGMSAEISSLMAEIRSTSSSIDSLSAKYASAKAQADSLSAVSQAVSSTINGFIPGNNSSGDTYIFNSPKALDPVSAANEMKKAKQQMALGVI